MRVWQGWNPSRRTEYEERKGEMRRRERGEERG